MKTFRCQKASFVDRGFNNRFVVEACEDFHFHYRNLRLSISYADWPFFAKGFADSYARWEKQGKPFGTHTELCRKTVASNAKNEEIKILQVQLNSALQHIEGLKATVELKGQELIQVKLERDNLLEVSTELKSKIEMLEQ